MLASDFGMRLYCIALLRTFSAVQSIPLRGGISLEAMAAALSATALQGRHKKKKKQTNSATTRLGAVLLAAVPWWVRPRLHPLPVWALELTCAFQFAWHSRIKKNRPA